MAKILVVEDDAHISRVVCLWLKRNGHEVLTASDGRSALEMVRTNRPDLLLTDVNLPHMDGLELLQAVRTQGLMDAPAIMLTSRCDQTEIAARAASLGAVVHAKPFSPVHLMEAIETALNTQRPQPQAESVGACDLLGAPRNA